MTTSANSPCRLVAVTRASSSAGIAGAIGCNTIEGMGGIECEAHPVTQIASHPCRRLTAEIRLHPADDQIIDLLGFQPEFEVGFAIERGVDALGDEQIRRAIDESAQGIAGLAGASGEPGRCESWRTSTSGRCEPRQVPTSRAILASASGLLRRPQARIVESCLNIDHDERGTWSGHDLRVGLRAGHRRGQEDLTGGGLLRLGKAALS